jgi:hypothetical protein
VGGGGTAGCAPCLLSLTHTPLSLSPLSLSHTPLSLIRPSPHLNNNTNRVKAGNEKRLDAKKKDAKKKSERRRRDWD